MVTQDSFFEEHSWVSLAGTALHLEPAEGSATEEADSVVLLLLVTHDTLPLVELGLKFKVS